MIKLVKGVEPQILIDNKANWKAKLLGHYKDGTKPPAALKTAYNQSSVKEGLKDESSSKCMYCESRIGHVSYEHIEHVKPKASDKYPELTYEYDNLGIACQKCNMNKGDDYDDNTPFINPYIDDPADHFNFFGAMIWAKAGNERAELTENELELNRPELLEARMERMNSVRALIDRYLLMDEGVLKKSLKKQIEIEISKIKIYSMCTSTLAKSMLN